VNKTEYQQTGKTDKHPYPISFSKEMVVFESGQGVRLTDAAGKTYLDFGSGIAVNALGYGRKDLADIAARQMEKLIHVSNLYATEPSMALGDKLLALGDFDAVHFGNSGTEANEAAIKFARIYSLNRKGKGNHKLLCFTNAFHGRTMGALSCTPTSKYQDPYAPLVPGVTVGTFNNVAELQSTLDETFAGVIVEVVQGEGGMDVMTPEFAEALNTLCSKHDVLLIADEVQTGLGRCGYPLASEAVGLRSDIVSLSKPLAGGLPLSATLIPAKVNNELHLGAHGSTFGGGPVTTAVAGKVVDIILAETFLDELAKKAEHLEAGLQEIVAKNPNVRGVKGLGFLRGLDLVDGAKIPDLMAALQAKGMLVLRSGTSVLRLTPPLVISTEDLDLGLSLIAETCTEIL
jgi:acetylornithine/N-succinyldiaminopimelate aminotransferase